MEAENKREAEELKQKGNTFFAASKFTEALEVYTKAILLDSTNHILYSNRSACYTSLQRYEEGLADANKCINLEPKWAKGHYRQGVILYLLYDIDAAVLALEISKQLAPTDSSIFQKLTEVLMFQNTCDKDYCYTEIQPYVFDPTPSNLVAAEKYITGSFTFLLESNPSCAFTLIDIILDEEQLDHIANANLELWIDTFSTISITLMAVEEFQVSERLVQRALPWFRKYVTHTKTNYVVAKYLLAMGQNRHHFAIHHEALRAYRQALRGFSLRPPLTYREKDMHIQLLNSASVTFLCMGSYGNAEATLLVALELYDKLEAVIISIRQKQFIRLNKSEMLKGLADLYTVAKMQNATALYAEALAIRTEILSAENYLIQELKLILLEPGPNYEQDLLHLKATTTNKSLRLNILVRLGEFYSEQGNLEHAKENLIKALDVAKELTPMKATILLMLGRISSDLQNYMEADKYYLMAMGFIETSCSSHLIMTGCLQYAIDLAKRGACEKGTYYLLSAKTQCTVIMQSLAFASSIDFKLKILGFGYDTIALCTQYLKVMNGNLNDIELDLSVPTTSQLAKFNFEVCNFILASAELLPESLRNEKPRKAQSIGYKEFMRINLRNPNDDDMFAKPNVLDTDQLLSRTPVHEDCFVELVKSMPADTGFVMYFNCYYFFESYFALVILPQQHTVRLISLPKGIDALVLKILPPQLDPITYTHDCNTSESGRIREIFKTTEQMEAKDAKEAIQATNDNEPSNIHVKGQTRNIPREHNAEVINTGNSVLDYWTVSEAIWEPVEKYLSGVTNIVVCRSGLLYLVPFEILPVDDEQPPEFVGLKYTFNYTTCNDYLKENTNGSELAPPIVIADPNYDMGTSGPNKQSSVRFKRLAGAEDEGRACAEILHVEPVMRDEANKMFLKNIRTPPVILHFATHAMFGEYSAIILAGANTFASGGTTPSENGNGLLNSDNIRFLPLNGTKLVVLSACETGVGEVSHDGMFGLVFAFLAAGAQCIVASMCPVEDIATKKFMICMYTKLMHERKTVNEAVSAARLLLKDAGEPLWSWGSFIIIGRGDIRV